MKVPVHHSRVIFMEGGLPLGCMAESLDDSRFIPNSLLSMRLLTV